VALLFQVLGSAIVVWEVWEGHRRWIEKFRPKTPAGRVIQMGRAEAKAFGYSARGLGGTLEERVSRLEAAQQRTENNLIDEVIRLEQRVIPAAAKDAAQDVRQRLEPIIRDTLVYLAGLGQRSKWTPWWLGPSLLLLGTVLGGVASLVGSTG
jgi:hypothetical protein